MTLKKLCYYLKMRNPLVANRYLKLKGIPKVMRSNIKLDRLVIKDLRDFFFDFI